MLAISQLCVDGLLEGVEGNVLQEGGEERKKGPKLLKQLLG